MSFSRGLPPQPTRRRYTATRLAVAVLVLLVTAYGGALLWLVTQETRIVFQAGRPLGTGRPAFPYEQVELTRSDGDRQFAWVMPRPEAQSWVLYLHGNRATIASRANIARYRELRRIGLNILAPEYRGFGGLGGVPSEAAVATDARAAYDYLVGARRIEPARIVVYGWSLGSAVAVQLAAQVTTGAVILEGAPASLVALGQQLYPLFPIRLIMRNPFESIRRIDRIGAPLLFLHSPEDEVIPIGEGRRLYEAAPSPKRFVEVRGGHINANEVDREVFFGAIRTFLGEHGLVDGGGSSESTGQERTIRSDAVSRSGPAAAAPRIARPERE
jgi:fermentation-respiration switch protein FrsA (DUF1100 family)